MPAASRAMAAACPATSPPRPSRTLATACIVCSLLDDVVLVNPFGLAIEDLAIAGRVYDVAR